MYNLKLYINLNIYILSVCIYIIWTHMYNSAENFLFPMVVGGAGHGIIHSIYLVVWIIRFFNVQ